MTPPTDHHELDPPHDQPPHQSATYWQALTIIFTATWILLNQKYGYSDAHAATALAVVAAYWASDRKW